MPLLSRLGSQPGVALDPEPHYRQAARETLALLHTDHPAADAIERLLDRFDNDAQRLQNQLVDMLAKRDQWMRHSYTTLDLKTAEAALRDLMADELALALSVLPPERQQLLMPAARHAASVVLTAQACSEPLSGWGALGVLEHWTTPLTGHPDEAPLWRTLPLLLLTKDGQSVRAKLPTELLKDPAGKALAEAAKPLMQALKDDHAAPVLKRLLRLPEPTYNEEEQALIGDLLTVLRMGHAQLWLGFQRAGAIDFTAMAQNALLALGPADAPSPLQLQLDYRIHHLLVDEFQDTSPTQVQLLERLMAGWQPGEARSLFLVGDPMQSIYKFRKADVGLFLNIKVRGLGGWPLTALHLYRNNRSYAAVVDWVNQTFPRVFATSDNHHRGAVRFAPAAATQGPHPLAGVHWHPLFDADDGSDEDAPALSEREAQQVLALIRSAATQDPEGKVAVLVRARTHLASLVTLLRSQDPPLAFQAVEIEPLAERQSIHDLTSLTHALHHLADRVHWLAILRAPWCGLTLADLHALAADDHHTPVWTLIQDAARIQRLSPDGQRRLGHVRQVIQAALPHQGMVRPRRWVEGVWMALGGPLCLADASELQNTAEFFHALQRCERDGLLDLSRLPRELQALYAAPDPQAADRLQLMTIHKSKGLEFDTVILPGLHRQSASTDRPLLLWDEVLDPNGHERLVVAAQPSRRPGAGDDDEAPAKYGLLHQLEAERAHHEAQRLLYVAVTRARRQLHLLGTVAPDAQQADRLKTPAKDSLLSLLWHAAEPAFVEARQAAARTQDASDLAPRSPSTPLAAYAHQLSRLTTPAIPAALQAPAMAASTDPARSTAPADSAPRADEPVMSQPERQRAADIGTLIHRYLDIIAREGVAQWPEKRIGERQPAMQRWLEQRGHSADDANRSAHEVVRQLITTCASPDGQWVLQPHAHAHNEWALVRPEGSWVQTQVIDRTFVADGIRWIIDYKTTRDAHQPASAYLEQLQRYQTLFDTDRPIRLAVLFTDRGELEHLDKKNRP
jgi:ATP-dependent exoDNAse (exonuclease V) beta subunit